jgi:ATPase family associated with various cellular activities (AAA)
MLQQRQVWRCDICRVCTFPTYQEACDHEVQCQPIDAMKDDDAAKGAGTAMSIVVYSSSSSAPSSQSPMMDGISSVVSSQGSIAVDPSKEGASSSPQAQLSNERRTKAATLQPAATVTTATPLVLDLSENSRKRAVRSMEDTTTSTTKKPVLSAKAECRPPHMKRSRSSVRTTRALIKEEEEDDDVQVVDAPIGNKSIKKSSKRGLHGVLREASLTTKSSRTDFGNGSHVTKRTKTTKTNKNEKNHLNYNKNNTNSKQNLLEWFTIPPEECSTLEDGPTESNHESFITEQVVAYQFMEQRRMKQQQEREKQLRQQLRREKESATISNTTSKMAASTFCLINNDDSVTNLTSHRNQVQRSQSSIAVHPPSNRFHHLPMAVRFPIPSHCIPSDSRDVSSYINIGDRIESTTDDSQPCWWHRNTYTVLRQQHQQQPTICDNGNVSLDKIQHKLFCSTTRRPLLVPSSEHRFSSDADQSNRDSMDLLPMTIRRYIVPSSNPHTENISHPALVVSNNTHDVNANTGTLWMDRYYNNASNCHLKQNHYSYGASQKMAQERLQKFIEPFMLERKKSELITKEKQKQRVLCSQPKSKQKLLLKHRSNRKHSAMYRAKHDDELWDDDSDYFDDIQDVDVNRLCLLSGPIGCGKSHLVHQVTKLLGCRKVVEIHTGMKRNAASIKRYIEEATKSHSTFDMIQNQNLVSTKSQTAVNGQTSNAVGQKVQRRKYVDSDDETDGNQQQLPTVVETEDRGSAVTVILFDEVDNLDPSIDHGFWTALSDLCKQSKCPIILTANTIPKELESSPFRWTHIPIERPTSLECAQQLRDILSFEGLTVRENCYGSPDGIADTVVDPLQAIAELGNCDVRRILQELQLFKVATSMLPQPKDEMCFLTRNECASCMELPPYNFPIVDSVRPHIISVKEYCQLSIAGSNFLNLVDPNSSDDNGYRCEVYIGNQKCPQARILDDSTIIAVTVPIQLPYFVNPLPTTKVDNGGIRSDFLTHAPVTVCSLQKLGLLSTTRNSLRTVDLPDQTNIRVAVNPFLIEYRLDVVKGKTGSDSENEFESSLSCRTVRQPIEETDPYLVSKLLKEGVDAWLSSHSEGIKNEIIFDTLKDKTLAEELQLVDSMCTRATLASDAALWEDIGMNIVPILSGACRGFGFDCTEEYPKRTNSNSKPYV